MDRIEGALGIEIGGATAERVVLAVFFLLGTVLGAYVWIPLPFTPVPVTLQTLFVLLGGAWLGRNWAAVVQGAYLAVGASGLAVFAGAAAGAFVLAGPDAGYLWGFLPASLLVGGLWDRASGRVASRVALLACADLLILLMGTAWLAFELHLGPIRAFLMGVAPFLPGEVVKVLAASALGPKGGARG
jgi:biotin transport system substrate-specific component